MMKKIVLGLKRFGVAGGLPGRPLGKLIDIRNRSMN